MSLLLRRRAMMQLAGSSVEPSGPNDGRIVVCRSGYGNYNGGRYVSTDYGYSYSRVTSPSLAYTSSNELDSEGTYYGRYSTYAIYVTGSNPTDTSYTRLGNTYAYPQAYFSSFVSESIEKIAVLEGVSANTPISRLSVLQKFGTKVDTLYTSSVPSFVQQKVGGCGAHISANKGDLSKIIIGCNAGAGVGIARCEAAISLDGGLTWNNVKDCLAASSSLPTSSYAGSAWSTDGKYCAIMHRNASSNYTLWISKNYGQTFDINILAEDVVPGETSFWEVKATANFKYIYAFVGNHLCRSKNLGKTWEQVFTFSVPNVRFEMNSDASHMIAWMVTGSNPVFWHSEDEGFTWTQATGQFPASTAHSSVNGFLNISKDDGNTSAVEAEAIVNNIATEVSFSLANTGSARKLTLYSDTEGQNVAYDFPPTVLYDVQSNPRYYYWFLYSCSIDGLTLDNRDYIVGGGTAKYNITGSCQQYGNVKWAYAHSNDGLKSLATDLYLWWGIRSASHG